MSQNIFSTPGSHPSAFESSTSALEALFAPRVVVAHDPTFVPPDAPEGSYTYALVQSAPAVPADEIESSADAVEIRVAWGHTVLRVAHLTPPRAFYVGSDVSKDAKADVVVPMEALGALRAPLVTVDGGSISVVVFARAAGTIELPGQPAMSVADAIARGLAQPSLELEGAMAIRLPAGAKAHLESGGFTFDVASVKAAKKVAGRVRLDGKSLPYTALSLALHLGILGAAATFMPPLAMADEGTIPQDQMAMIQHMLATTAEREPEQKQEEATSDSTKPNEREGGTGAQAMGESGKMGSQTSNATNRRYAVEGPADNADPHIAKSNLLRDAASFGMIGLLNSAAAGDPNAPTAIWGRDEALGNDPRSAMGNMWGQEIGDAQGIGSLGLTGIGEGGGGRYEGIGVGVLGTIGHGSGLGNGQGFGPGSGYSRSLGRGKHDGHTPVMRVANTVVSGHIPPEVIQRIVRQNFGRFRLCYENGLRNSPNLAGRVSVRFVIGRDGSVSNAGNGGSDLPDPGVVSCVTRAFYGLSFPQPEDGIVTVTYPIMFSPGGA